MSKELNTESFFSGPDPLLSSPPLPTSSSESTTAQKRLKFNHIGAKFTNEIEIAEKRIMHKKSTMNLVKQVSDSNLLKKMKRPRKMSDSSLYETNIQDFREYRMKIETKTSKNSNLKPYTSVKMKLDPVALAKSLVDAIGRSAADYELYNNNAFFNASSTPEIEERFLTPDMFENDELLEAINYSYLFSNTNSATQINNNPNTGKILIRQF